MKKVLLLPLLLLAACAPNDDSMIVEMQETLTIVEEARLPYYPYFTDWQVCEINGEVFENVTFMYTDLGLGYMVDNILYYRLNMEVTYCEGVLVEGVNKE